MPQAVVAAVIAFAASFEIYQTIFLVAVALYGDYQGRKLKKRLSESAGLGVADNQRSTSVTQPITHWRLVYGELLVSGPITFLHSTDNNRYLNILVTLAAHEVAEIGDVYFNDERIPQESNGQVTGRWRNNAQIYKGLGTTAGDAALLTALQMYAPGKWTADHKQEGRAKLYVRFRYDQELFRGGLPNLRAVVKGRKLFDPRSSTTTWTNNWALVVRDYMLDPAVGVGATIAEIDEASFIAAANLADEQVTTQPKASKFVVGKLAAPSASFRAASIFSPGTLLPLYFSITYVTAAGETPGSHTNDRVVVINNEDANIRLTNIPIGPTGVTGRKIYLAFGQENGDATRDPITPYKLIATINDNVTTSYDYTTPVPDGADIPAANTTLPTHIELTQTGIYFETGDAVQLTTTGTLPGGLSTGNTYYYITRGGSKDNVANSLANARAGIAIAFTSDGSGEHTLTKVAEPRYCADGVVQTEDKPRDTLNEMLTAGSGKLLYVNGKWTLYGGAYRTPTITLDENDLDGNPQVTSRLGKRSLINGVKGIYVSPDAGWQPTDFPPVKNATYLAQDQNERLWRDIELPWTLSSATAQRIAKIELESARQQITVRWPCKLSALRVQAGDVIGLTYSRFGWTAKPFEVIELEFKVRGEGDNQRLGVDLFLRETASSVYDWASGEEGTIDPAPDTDLPNAFFVNPPVLHEPQSGTQHLYLRNDGTVFSRIFQAWDAAADEFVLQGGQLELQYRQQSQTDWQDAGKFPGSSTSAYILDVQDTATYFIRARFVNNLGARSQWSPAGPHTVVGKTEPPASVGMLDFDGSFLSWPANTEADKAGYIVRYQPSGSNNWDTATLAHKQGFITETTFDTRDLIGGSTRLLVKAIDTSGNTSLNVTSVVVDLRPPAPNVFTITRQPDGTREFMWQTTMPPAPADLAGARIRWFLGTTSDWSAMTALHEGLLLASPFETNQLAAGSYTFAIKNVDFAGNESVNATFITTTIGDPRIANALEDFNEAPTWTASKLDCQIDPGTGWLLADNQDPWANLPSTWGAWTSWITNPVGSIAYVREIDIGVPASFVPLVTVLGDGTMTLTEQHGGAPKLSFDGINDTAMVPFNSLFNYERTDSFTFYARVRSSDAMSGLHVIATRFSSALNRGIGFYCGGGVFGLFLRDSNARELGCDSSGTVLWNDGGIHDLVATYNGSSSNTGVRLYIDGTEILSPTRYEGATPGPLTGTIQHSEEISFASFTDGASQYTNMELFRLATWKRALSASEAKRVSLGLGVATTNLVGRWKFNEGSGTSVADSSGNGLNATISGATWGADPESFTDPAALGAKLTARFVRIAAEVAGSFPKLKTMRSILSAQLIEEIIEDRASSSMSGTTGDRRLPITNSYSIIKKVDVTLQSVGPGWSWELIDKNNSLGPRIKIYNASNVLADATIDATIKGLPT